MHVAEICNEDQMLKFGLGKAPKIKSSKFHKQKGVVTKQIHTPTPPPSLFLSLSAATPVHLTKAQKRYMICSVSTR